MIYAESWSSPSESSKLRVVLGTPRQWQKGVTDGIKIAKSADFTVWKYSELLGEPSKISHTLQWRKGGRRSVREM